MYRLLTICILLAITASHYVLQGEQVNFESRWTSVLLQHATAAKWEAHPAARRYVESHIEVCGPGVLNGPTQTCGYRINVTDALFEIDMTENNIKVPVNWRRMAQHASFPARNLPHNFDWRDELNGICPGENQGSCGSCWMFGGMHVMQDVIRLLRPNEPCVDISAQWGVDCEPDDFYGCGGGYMPFNKFLSSKGRGPVYTKDYGPYRARNMRCQTNKIKYDVSRGIEKWGYVSQKPDQIRAAILKHGPIAITERAFGSGVQGVYNRCRPGGGTNHITSLIGWKHLDPSTLKEVSTGGDLYWIRRNSWRGTGDSHYGALLVKATSGSGSSGRACQNMAQTAAFVYGLDHCKPKPEADPGEDAVLIKIDGTERIQLGTPGKEGHNYKWTPATGLDNPSVAQPWASPDQTTEYELEVSTECGTATQRVMVEVIKPL